MLAVVPFFRKGKTVSALGEAWSETLLVGLYESLFLTNAICTVLALAHQAVEWIYLARHKTKRSTYLLLICVFFGLSGAIWVFPTMESSRLGANKEISQQNSQSQSPQPSQQLNPDDEESLDINSQVKYYQFWKNAAGLYHWIFLISSLVWISRLARPTNNLRSYHY